jgi:SAM-dependent methyltransferase
MILVASVRAGSVRLSIRCLRARSEAGAEPPLTALGLSATLRSIGNMFSKRSDKTELVDDLALDDVALRRNLQELEAVNRWLGGKSTLISALNEICQQQPRLLTAQTITIADLGCGGGDLLRAVHEWAKAKSLNVELIGVDANPFMVRYAVEKSRAFGEIRFTTVNVLSDAFKTMRFDIVCLNTFCHHLSNADLIKLLTQLREQASTAIIVNDLHRHWIAYLSIKAIARLLDFSYLAQHDGPLSVLRAFRKCELIDFAKLAHFDCYRIRWRWAFRWQVILWKK